MATLVAHQLAHVVARVVRIGVGDGELGNVAVDLHAEVFALLDRLLVLVPDDVGSRRAGHLARDRDAVAVDAHLILGLLLEGGRARICGWLGRPCGCLVHSHVDVSVGLAALVARL